MSKHKAPRIKPCPLCGCDPIIVTGRLIPLFAEVICEKDNIAMGASDLLDLTNMWNEWVDKTLKEKVE